MAEAEPLQRALEIVRAIARDRSTSVVPVPGGQAVLNSDFPAAHDLNRLIITAECTSAAVAAAAEEVLGGAGLSHRLVDVHDQGLGRGLGPGLAARGYVASEDLVMAATGPSRRRPPALPVVALGVDERAAVATAEWRRDQPDWADDVVAQLGRRINTVLAAADPTFLAVRGQDGAVIAHADLYLRNGVAQVEEVMTDPEQRGRGLATLLVLRAVERARRAGSGLVFLLADAEDWPAQLYRDLGFTDLGRTVTFRSSAAAAGD